MRLEIDTCEGECRVDRDGVSCGLATHSGEEGFEVTFAGLTIHFQCESDAVDMAKKILRRMGELPTEVAT